jgi:replication factor C subunit 3/5
MCDRELKPEIIHIAADYEHQMQLGDKKIFYLEAFVVKFMALYKKFFDQSVVGMM